MSNTYNWIVERLDAYPQKDGFDDVVFTVHWRVNAEDGDGHQATVYGTQGVELNAEEPFTPYDKLTKEKVLGWVQDAMGQGEVAAKTAYLDQQIANQINPPVVSPALPWSN